MEDAIGEAEAGNGTKKSRRRISDYLGDSDGGEASPPQLRLPRFTCATFRFARLGRKRGGRKEAGAKQKTEAASVDSSADDRSVNSPAIAAGSKPAAGTSTSSSNSSASSAEAGGGMGLSMLLLLLVRTCVELNRMAEVRAQMAALLNEIRNEAGKMKVAVTPPARTFSLHLSSSSGCTSDTDANHRHATTSSSAEEETVPVESKPAEGGGERRNTGVVEMEAAAELEAEPAPHGPTIEWNAEQENSESSDDKFIELDGGLFVGGGGGCRKWKWSAGDEDSEEEDSAAGAQGDGGVCAVELERRLHEVLHRRNRERIEELESALRRAGQRLREKEMEARLWQDTATLALQPPRDGGH